MKTTDAGTSCDHGDGGRSTPWSRPATCLMAMVISFAAQAATPRLVAFAVRHTGLFARRALPGAECERLHLRRPCVTETRIACRSTFAAPARESRRADRRSIFIAALASATSVAAD